MKDKNSLKIFTVLNNYYHLFKKNDALVCPLHQSAKKNTFGISSIQLNELMYLDSLLKKQDYK